MRLLPVLHLQTFLSAVIHSFVRTFLARYGQNSTHEFIVTQAKNGQSRAKKDPGQKIANPSRF
jgi:hypothetical protein